MSTISRNSKISHIWVLAKELGFDGNCKEFLYDIVEQISGGRSISALSTRQLNELVGTLVRIKHSQSRRSDSTYPLAVRIPSADQRSKVTELLTDLTSMISLKKPEAYLESICKRTFGKPYRSLNGQQVQSLIEALKSVKKRNSSPGGAGKI